MTDTTKQQRELAATIALECTGADPKIHDVTQSNFAVFMDADALLKFAKEVARPVVTRLAILENMVDMHAIPVSEHSELACSAAMEWLKEEALENAHAQVTLDEWTASIGKLLLRGPQSH